MDTCFSQGSAVTDFREGNNNSNNNNFFSRYVALNPNFVRFHFLGLHGGPRLLPFLRFMFSRWALFVYIEPEWACHVSLELVARAIPYVLYFC